MKKTFIGLICSILSCAFASGQDIVISTDRTDLIMKVGDNGRLYQAYLGAKLLTYDDMSHFNWSVGEGGSDNITEFGWEVYPGAGSKDYYEPALAVTHAGGNLCTVLEYVSHDQNTTTYGTATEITMQDKLYPVEVKLHYEAYTKENVIKVWTEIKNNGKKPISLWRYASAMLYFTGESYFLTEFSSDWAKEVQMRSQQLQPGRKVLETKLGSRSAMHIQPFFELGVDGPVRENEGQALLGTLGWTGNFSFTFEVDNMGNLRVIPAINPWASTVSLEKGKVFVTPEFVFSLSQNGAGEASRCFHDWARRYQVKDGMSDRLTLLNNWENTRFNFTQDLLAGLMGEAANLGVDMFLLDDGWFGNKHPRNSSHAGLGDWEENAEKLPGGIAALTAAAADAGVKFGIWIEPEMVNPKSELFEKHPDWAYTLPDRKMYFYRNQLVLDLNNPAVQDYVFGVVDRILSENPDIKFFKWDCNSPITNVFSHYLKDKQQELYVGHVRGLYNVLDRVKNKYPDVMMMLCSGGGARCDYEVLKYFTEFWCSDNTDPVERLFIQWGYSQFFPAKVMCAHVTNWNRNTSIKFRTDVASMCKLGFDIGLGTISEDELQFMKRALANWTRLKPVILDGDQYRLVSPYESNHTATMYVSKDASHAVLFAFDINPRFREKVHRVKLEGLDPSRKYRVSEINRMDGTMEVKSEDAASAAAGVKTGAKVYTGDFLMKVGLNVFSANPYTSKVLEIVAE